MVDSASGKIEWSIKKDDFLSGKFDGATFELGSFTWSLLSNNKNPLQADVVSFTLSCTRKVNATNCCFYSCWQSFGTVCLKGLDGYNVMKPWCSASSVVQLKVDNTTFSFDEKYLFSDGTYRVEFSVEQNSSFVDFTLPDHPLILGYSDAGCLQIEETKIYVSKSYFSAQSPYFKALFFGDFKEKNQDVIILHNVRFDAFKEFLKHLYFSQSEFLLFDQRLRRESIPEVLALADMFVCNIVMRSCETMLTRQDLLTVDDLQLADKYRLHQLRVKVIAQLPVSELKNYLAKILDCPESLYTRLFIVERIEGQ